MRSKSQPILVGLVAAAAALAAPAGHASVVYATETGSTHPVIWVARNDGSGRRQLLRIRSPWILLAMQVSPDGRWIVYEKGPMGQDEPSQLMVISSSGGRSRRLAEAASIAAWSPNSRTLAAIVVPLTGNERLVTIRLSSGSTRTVATAQAFSGVSFSPNGDRIAYAAGPSGESGGVQTTRDVYVVSAKGGRVQRLTSDHHSENPAWGPRRIAFSRWRDVTYGSHRTRVEELYLVSSSGEGLHRLTDVGAYGLTAVGWSADGRRLLANISTSSYYAVTVDPGTGWMNRVGQPSKRNGPNGIAALALSRDGSKILGWMKTSYRTVGTTLVTIPYGGGSSHVVARAASDASWDA